jgi:hypothetical protein
MPKNTLTLKPKAEAVVLRTRVKARTFAARSTAPQYPSLLGVTQMQLDHTLAKVKSMTPAQFKQSLIDCGVLTKSGKSLAKPYRN